MEELWNRSELLKKLTNINEQCSDIESDATNSELSSENETTYNIYEPRKKKNFFSKPNFVTSFL